MFSYSYEILSAMPQIELDCEFLSIGKRVQSGVHKDLRRHFEEAGFVTFALTFNEFDWPCLGQA